MDALAGVSQLLTSNPETSAVGGDDAAATDSPSGPCDAPEPAAVVATSEVTVVDAASSDSESSNTHSPGNEPATKGGLSRIAPSPRPAHHHHHSRDASSARPQLRLYANRNAYKQNELAAGFALLAAEEASLARQQAEAAALDQRLQKQQQQLRALEAELMQEALRLGAIAAQQDERSRQLNEQAEQQRLTQLELDATWAMLQQQQQLMVRSWQPSAN